MKQFIRNFNKQKVVGMLNICSLSLGVMVAVIVGLWTINELSFDNFHKDKDRMYRIVEHITLNGSPTKLGSTFMPFGDAAKAVIPEIEDMCRVVINNGGEIRIAQTLHLQNKVLMVDANFFSFFTFPLKEGRPEDVLSAPNKVVISENAAANFFPGQDAIGQNIRYEEQDFEVSGIMKNMPLNSSFRGDMIFPFFGAYLTEVWGQRDNKTTFFTFHKGTDVSGLTASFDNIIRNNFPSMMEVGYSTELEAVNDMHFGGGFLHDFLAKGNKALILIFTLIAFVILIISCINFTNLFISTSFLRAKTIGIKKAQGAVRNNLIADFYGETACYVLIAIAAGIFLAYLALPIFNNFTGADVSINPLSPALYGFLSVLFVFTVLMAGTFPAFYMTRFNPIQTLGGKFKGKNVSTFQKSLIIIQFSASIALLITVTFMQRQVQFMVNHDLGFNKENVMYVYGRDNFARNYDSFRNDLLNEPSITDVTMKNCLPTDWNQGWGINNVGSSNVILMETTYIKPNYFEFMDMKIMEGENPLYLESTDSITPVVINESALRLLGLESPINQIIIANGHQHMVVKGVMRNAYVHSLRDEIDPQVYMKLTWDNWSPVFFKVTGDPQRAISAIRAKWEELEPDFPFEYHFLDDTYKDLYTSEVNSGKVFAFAMLITFIISIAGLFAMAFYATQRRIKEIGLRKVNGATLKDLLLLLNKDFVLWVLISFLIAAPIAYFSLQSWLAGFTVKTSLSVWIFLLVGIIAMAVALLTTSFQTWKVATMNPVKTLKSE